MPEAEYEVEVSSAASLHCVASGNPTPIITWLKNGEPLNQSNTILIQEEQSLAQTLTFVNSSLTFLAPSKDDSGLYWCRASNAHSTAEFNRRYDVKVEDTTPFDSARECMLTAVLKAVWTAKSVWERVSFYILLSPE